MAARNQIYTPSGKSPTRGMLLVLVLGAIASLISSLLYFLMVEFLGTLIVLVPLGFGFGIGFLMKKGVHRGKIRNPRLIRTIGWMFGIGAYLLSFIWGYQYTKYDFVKQAEAEYGTMPPALKAEVVNILENEILPEVTGYPGFVGYVYFKADNMSIINDFGEMDAHPVVGLGIFLFEIFIIGMMTADTASKPAKEPFCERDQTWYEKKDILKTTPEDGVKILKLMSQGLWDQLPQEVGSPHSTEGNAVYNSSYCPVCGDTYLSINMKKGNKTLTLDNLHLDATKVSYLERISTR